MTEMKQYDVTFTETILYTITVKAIDDEEALYLASQIYENDTEDEDVITKGRLDDDSIGMVDPYIERVVE